MPPLLLSDLIVHGDAPLRGRLVPSVNKNAVLPLAEGWVQTIKVADLISNTGSIVIHDPVLGRFDDAPQRSGGNEEAAHRLARPTTAIMGLVLFSLFGLVLEGAVVDWSAIYMRDVFGAAPFFGALAVTLRRARARRRALCG